MIKNDYVTSIRKSFLNLVGFKYNYGYLLTYYTTLRNTVTYLRVELFLHNIYGQTAAGTTDSDQCPDIKNVVWFHGWTT